MTAAIVAAGPALPPAVNPGAIRHRGWLRIIGTFIRLLRRPAHYHHHRPRRCDAAVVLHLGRFLHLALFTDQGRELLRLGPTGRLYTVALIIIVTVATSEAHSLEAPQFAIERCSEIVLGIVSAVLADLAVRAFRSTDIDRAVDQLLVDHA